MPTATLVASLAAIAFFILLLEAAGVGFGLRGVVGRLPEGLRPIVAGATGLLFPLIAYVTVRLLDDAAVLQPLGAFFTEHRRIGLQVAGTAAAVGFVLFMGAILHLILTASGPSEVFTLAGLKQALRRGTWWRSPRWRRRLVVLVGVGLLTFGLFGLAAVLGPPGVKLVVMAALVYATVRTAVAAVRA